MPRIKEKIYLDYNSTVPVLQEVVEAVLPIYSQPYNASSIHSYGRDASRIIGESRRKIATAIGAEGAEIVFTSSGTEANNMAMNCLGDVDNIIISAIEHLSLLRPAKLKNAILIPVDNHGLVIIDELKKILSEVEGKSLVSVMLANNETGVIQPVKEIAELVYSYSGYFHCDASQAFGKIAVGFSDINADMMTISAHKIGGIQGAAALIFKKGLEVVSQIKGGGQESGYRAGTENIAAIVGFGVAAENIKIGDSSLRDYLENEIISFAHDNVIFGKNVDRLPNTSYITMRNVTGETQSIAFDIEGIAVSSGSACSSGTVNKSHVLDAMGIDGDIAANAVRVSMGRETTKEEIDKFISVWKDIYLRKNGDSSKSCHTAIKMG